MDSAKGARGRVKGVSRPRPVTALLANGPDRRPARKTKIKSRPQTAAADLSPTDPEQTEKSDNKGQSGSTGADNGYEQLTDSKLRDIGSPMPTIPDGNYENTSDDPDSTRRRVSRQQSRSWAVTIVLDNNGPVRITTSGEGTKENDKVSSLNSSFEDNDGEEAGEATRTDDVIETAVAVLDDVEDDDVAESNEEVGSGDGQGAGHVRQSLQDWLEGSEQLSDEYDTDLEEECMPAPGTPVDAAGRYHYEEECKRQGIIPVSYLMRNLGEGNLRMRHHYLGGSGTFPLAEALKRNTICEEIDLSDNYLEGDGAASLADMLKENMFVVNLNIAHNFIRSKGVEAFACMLETNTTLKTLSLKGNQLSDGDAKIISEAIRNNMSLSCLDLSCNHFGEMGGVNIGAGLAANIGLGDLDLSWNCIRQKGAVAIAKGLQKNTTLEILDLSWNGLAFPGTVAMAQALKLNKTLRVLDLSNNRINGDAAKKLGVALAKNVGLETLLMGMNPIDYIGVEAILKGAAANATLKLLGLEDISIAPELRLRIKDMMESRDILIMFTAGSPQQSKMNQTILAVFDRFITENADRMEDLFTQMDKDKSGNITLEEFKFGLKDFGLRLTSKQLDMLLEELDADRSGTIELEELLKGSALVRQEKKKMARVEKEARIYADSSHALATAAAAAASSGPGTKRTEPVR